jgi:tetratricopeptide (TPR) repeat protein
MFTNTSDAKQRQLASEPKFLEDLLISELNCSLAGLLASPDMCGSLRLQLPGLRRGSFCTGCSCVLRAVCLTVLLIAGAVASAQNERVADLVRQGQAAIQAEQFDRAAQAFEQARQIGPERKDVSRALVLSYLQIGHLAEAEHVGTAALEHWPNDAELLHLLGLVYFKQQKNDLALSELQRAANLSPSRYDIHFDLALVLLSGDHYSEAAKELETAIRLDGKPALPHVLLGRAYQNTNRSMQAVRQFQSALSSDPNLPLVHYHLGFAYESLGSNEAAIAEYEKEVRRSPNSPTVLYQLGHCQISAGLWKSAIEHLEKATQFDSENADAFYDLGKALVLQGDAERAVPALRRAAELKPSNPTPHYQLSRALQKLGRREESERELETFTTLNKALPVTGGMAAGPVQ